MIVNDSEAKAGAAQGAPHGIGQAKISELGSDADTIDGSVVEGEGKRVVFFKKAEYLSEVGIAEIGGKGGGGLLGIGDTNSKTQEKE